MAIEMFNQRCWGTINTTLKWTCPSIFFGVENVSCKRASIGLTWVVKRPKTQPLAVKNGLMLAVNPPKTWALKKHVLCNRKGFFKIRDETIRSQTIFKTYCCCYYCWVSINQITFAVLFSYSYDSSILFLVFNSSYDSLIPSS